MAFEKTLVVGKGAGNPESPFAEKVYLVNEAGKAVVGIAACEIATDSTDKVTGGTITCSDGSKVTITVKKAG